MLTQDHFLCRVNSYQSVAVTFGVRSESDIVGLTDCNGVKAAKNSSKSLLFTE